jgi:hypothetical protein
MTVWRGALAGGLMIAAVVGCGAASPTAVSPGSIATATGPAGATGRSSATAAKPTATVASAAALRLVTPASSATAIRPAGSPVGQEKSGMQGTPFPTPPDAALQRVIELARADLAARVSVTVDQVELVEAQSVVWPDRSLGCPRPGMVYPQVPQDGLLIRFRVTGRIYQYHGGGDRAPFLCEQPAAPPSGPPPGRGV